MTPVLPGFFVSPWHLLANTDIDTVRYGNMELFKGDEKHHYPDLFLRMLLKDISIESGKKVAYMEI